MGCYVVRLNHVTTHTTPNPQYCWGKWEWTCFHSFATAANQAHISTTTSKKTTTISATQKCSSAEKTHKLHLAIFCSCQLQIQSPFLDQLSKGQNTGTATTTTFWSGPLNLLLTLILKSSFNLAHWRNQENFFSQREVIDYMQHQDDASS